ncbi:MAG: M23 family metallopeptidase [Candidatus Parabeggiatoa sp.]|nr:M23 family metallopeptidase [Candidatus Parabeggiatoa sp.]
MDVILIRKNVVKSGHTHFRRSVFVPVAFVSMLSVASVAFSAYYHYGGQGNHATSTTLTAQVSTSKGSLTSTFQQDNFEELALRVNALHQQASQLNHLGNQLVKRDNASRSHFSLSWNKIVSKNASQHNTTSQYSSNTSRRIPRKSSVSEVKRSIKMVSKRLLRKYRAHTKSLPDGWPLKQGRVSSKFGWRGRRMHKGIDIAASRGTPIYAVEDGIVVSSKYARGYGRLIEIKHSDMYTTRYAHNHINLVEVGEFVYKGEMIGEVGSTGRSTGPHVHFEVRQSGLAINPVKYLGAMDSFTLLSENIKLSEYVKLSRK